MCQLQIYYCDARKARHCLGRWEQVFRPCRNQHNGCRPVKTANFGQVCRVCKRAMDEAWHRRSNDTRQWELKSLLEGLAAAKNASEKSEDAENQSTSPLTMTLPVRSRAPTREQRDRPPPSQRWRSRSPQPRRAPTLEPQLPSKTFPELMNGSVLALSEGTGGDEIAQAVEISEKPEESRPSKSNTDNT